MSAGRTDKTATKPSTRPTPTRKKHGFRADLIPDADHNGLQFLKAVDEPVVPVLLLRCRGDALDFRRRDPIAHPNTVDILAIHPVVHSLWKRSHGLLISHAICDEHDDTLRPFPTSHVELLTGIQQSLRKIRAVQRLKCTWTYSGNVQLNAQ